MMILRRKPDSWVRVVDSLGNVLRVGVRAVVGGPRPSVELLFEGKRLEFAIDREEILTFDALPERRG